MSLLTTAQRFVLALMCFALAALSVLSGCLAAEYYFGSGYGLIGWISVPMSIGMAYLAATAGAAAYDGYFPWER